MEQETIGTVKLDYSRYPGEDLYSDGAIEDTLLGIVREAPEGDYDAAIREQASWPVLYHLSPQRENIVRPLPIGKEEKVLEVGSGCGAITGALARMAGEVTCVDLSRKRSLVNAWRHRSLENITIRVGNFREIEPDLPADYDWICLIGVFEYGQAYIGGERPYEEFLERLKRHLAPDGRLVLAIENRFGLKYWAGCREDHNGEYFSGLEGYPKGGGARTFTRRALEELLRGAGLGGCRFFYPYPDYKFPHTIYSDGRLPRRGELSTNLRNFDRERMLLFDEKAVFDSVLSEGEFPLFANSYLVVAKRMAGEEPDGERLLYAKYSNERAARYQLQTEIYETGGKRNADGTAWEAAEGSSALRVRKQALTEEAKLHLAAMERACRALEERYEGSGLRICPCRRAGESALEFPYLAGRGLEEVLDERLLAGDEEGFRKLIAEYRRLLEYRAERGPADYDFLFQNILVGTDGTWSFIDYEFSDEETLRELLGETKPPLGEVAFRALDTYWNGSARRKGFLEKWCLDLFGIRREDMEGCREREQAFQKRIVGDGIALGEMRERIGMPVIAPASGEVTASTAKLLGARVQIYPDTGSGFAEETSEWIPAEYRTDEGAVFHWEFRFRIPAGTRRLRIDPALFPCYAAVEQLAVDGRRIPGRLCLVKNGRRVGDGEYLFRGEDPQIRFRVPGKRDFERELSVRMRVARLE